MAQVKSASHVLINNHQLGSDAVHNGVVAKRKEDLNNILRQIKARKDQTQVTEIKANMEDSVSDKVVKDVMKAQDGGSKSPQMIPSLVDSLTPTLEDQFESELPPQLSNKNYAINWDKPGNVIDLLRSLAGDTSAHHIFRAKGYIPITKAIADQLVYKNGIIDFRPFDPTDSDKSYWIEVQAKKQ